MANLSITILNTLDFFGPSNATKWNSFTWNAANWGQDADLGTQTTKVVDSTATPDSDMVKYVLHGLDFGSTALDSDVVKNYVMTILNALSVSADMYSETLRDGAGYYYLYPNNATNAEDRDFPTWTSSGANSTTWTNPSTTPTTWSNP